MSLLSTETSAEKDVIGNFLAQNGAQLKFLYIIIQRISVPGLDADLVWTSLNKGIGGSFAWLGGVENSLEETANISGGDCAALKGKLLQAAACNISLPYVCEKNQPV